MATHYVTSVGDIKMSKFPQETWNQGDVIKMEKVRTLLCDIYTKSGEMDENKHLSTLITNVIVASLLLRTSLEDSVSDSVRDQTVEEQIIAVRQAKYDREESNRKYTENMHKWMEENTND
tara:strand:- start:1489 stop:1848 length:360 start_codon:yes stop_codon:yes gene_type:complete